MATRDELLARLHDGELSPAAAESLSAELTDEEQQKLRALSELDGLLENTLKAEADAKKLDLWAELERKLPPLSGPSEVAQVADSRGKILPFLRRRTVQITAAISTLAAAAGLLFMLRSGAPSNRCDIEELDIAGGNATVIAVPDEQGHKTTTLIWFDHQETDEWESL